MINWIINSKEVKNNLLKYKNLKTGDLFMFLNFGSLENQLLMKTSNDLEVIELSDGNLINLSIRHLDYDVYIYQLTEPIKVKMV